MNQNVRKNVPHVSTISRNKSVKKGNVSNNKSVNKPKKKKKENLIGDSKDLVT